MERITSQRNNGLNEYTYQHSMREGFANQSLVIYTNPEHIIVSLKANSAATGVAIWSKDVGLLECRLWEGEESAGAHGYLSQHFPAEVLGETGDDATGDKILSECLAFMKDPDTVKIIRDFCWDTTGDITFFNWRIIGCCSTPNSFPDSQTFRSQTKTQTERGLWRFIP